MTNISPSFSLCRKVNHCVISENVTDIQVDNVMCHNETWMFTKQASYSLSLMCSGLPFCQYLTMCYHWYSVMYRHRSANCQSIIAVGLVREVYKYTFLCVSELSHRLIGVKFV